MSYIFHLYRDKQKDEPKKAFRTKKVLDDLNQKNETPFEFINIEIGSDVNGAYWCCGFMVDCEEKDVSVVIDWLTGRGFGVPKVYSFS